MERSLYIHVEDNDENIVDLARSQFDTCPGCDGDDIEAINCTMDDPQFMILCRKCQWGAFGETITQAVINWNNRSPILTALRSQNAEMKEAISAAAKLTTEPAVYAILLRSVTSDYNPELKEIVETSPSRHRHTQRQYRGE